MGVFSTNREAEKGKFGLKNRIEIGIFPYNFFVPYFLFYKKY